MSMSKNLDDKLIINEPPNHQIKQTIKLLLLNSGVKHINGHLKKSAYLTTAKEPQ